MRLVYWLITALLALILVMFAVSNRGAVVVTFWPLPATLEAPLYLVLLLALLAGFLLGEFVAWINAGRTRRALRERNRRIEALERAAAQAQLPQASTSAPRLPRD
jgi:uncharacterized integral membrane protein